MAGPLAGTCILTAADELNIACGLSNALLDEDAIIGPPGDNAPATVLRTVGIMPS